MADSKGANRLFFIIVTVFVAVSIIMGRVLPEETPVYVSIILSQSAVLLPALLYCLKRKISIKELIPHKKISFSTGVLVVVTTYLMYPLMMVLNAITLLFTQSATVEMQSEMAEFNIIVSVLLIAAVPACVEEFVFRGVLFQSYRKKRVFSAILLSAFLFGCMHMNLNQFVYAFAMGIYMAFLVEGTGSIFSSMLAHFTLNFTGVALNAVLKLMNNGQEISAEAAQNGNFLQSDKVYVVVMLVTIMMLFVVAAGTTTGAIAIYIQICKRNGRLEKVKRIFQRKNTERLITVPLVLGVAVTLVFIIMSI